MDPESPFAREGESFEMRLKARINEITAHKDKLLQDIEASTLPDQRAVLRQKVDKLFRLLERGGELIGTGDPGKIEAFLTEDYKFEE